MVFACATRASASIQTGTRSGQLLNPARVLPEVLNEGHAGAEFDSLGHLTGRGQNHERVHGVVVLFGHLASARKGASCAIAGYVSARGPRPTRNRAPPARGQAPAPTSNNR